MSVRQIVHNRNKQSPIYPYLVVQTYVCFILSKLKKKKLKNLQKAYVLQQKALQLLVGPFVSKQKALQLLVGSFVSKQKAL